MQLSSLVGLDSRNTLVGTILQFSFIFNEDSSLKMALREILLETLTYLHTLNTNK
jgi:hypothetical protein